MINNQLPNLALGNNGLQNQEILQIYLQRLHGKTIRIFKVNSSFVLQEINTNWSTTSVTSIQKGHCDCDQKKPFINQNSFSLCFHQFIIASIRKFVQDIEKNQYTTHAEKNIFKLLLVDFGNSFSNRPKNANIQVFQPGSVVYLQNDKPYIGQTFIYGPQAGTDMILFNLLGEVPTNVMQISQCSRCNQQYHTLSSCVNFLS